MGRAHREVPPVTWVEECDFSNVELKRLVPTVLKAVAESLQEFPELNARLEGDAIVYLDRYDLGVAVQTDQGLVVPVVRACEAKSLDELADEVARLAEAARAGTLKPEELRDSTFTVTSAGKLGGLLTTPIVNHPEVAILSVGRVAERPVVRDGEIAGAPDRHDRDHLRPPRRRRRPGGRVRARRDRAPRSPRERLGGRRRGSTGLRSWRARPPGSAGRASRRPDASRCARSRSTAPGGRRST